MLSAFLDESYNPSRNPGRMVIAGLVGTDEEWDAVGARWAATLVEHNAPPFHASKVAGQHGDYVNWAPEDCDALRADLAKVLAASSLGEIVSGFVGDWSEVLRQCPGIEKRFPSEYEFCFELAVAQMERAAERWFDGAAIACVFDQNQKYEDHALKVWKARQVIGQWDKIASIAHGNHRTVVQLQCADMIAHENFQAPRVGAQNLPALSRLHKRSRALFSGRKQWDETLIPNYWRDPVLKDIFYPTEPPPMTPEEQEAAHQAHDELVAKYAHLS